MATIKRNFLYNLLLQISKVLFPLITAPYIARVLDPSGVGICNFVSTYSSYFALFAVLGIPMYGIREVAKVRDDCKALETFVSQIISIELVSTLIVSIFYLLSVLIIDQLNVNALLFLIAGISLYISPFKIEWFFSGKEEFGYITFRSLIIKTISVLLLFIVVRTKEDLINYVLLNVFASIANEFWNYVKLLKSGIKPRIHFKGCNQHLKAIFTLFCSTIAISIYCMLDTLMLGFLSSYQEVGYYNSAMHVVKALLPIATTLSAVALPRVANYIESGQTQHVNELMNKSLGIVSFLAFPLALGVIMIAPQFVPNFFGNEFYGAILPMQIGSLVIIAIGLNNLNGIQVLIGSGKDKQFLWSVSSGAVSNFILNYFLIPQYGAAGAAFASVFAELQILAVNEYLVRKYTEVKVSNFSDLLKSLIGALLFIPICLGLGLVVDGWLFVGLTTLVCIVVYTTSQYIFRNSMFNMILNLLINKIIKK